MKRTDLQKIDYPIGISAQDRHFVRRIVNSVRDFINVNKLQKVLVAFSAGHDSTVLACICHKVSLINGTSFDLSYIDHGLRPRKEIDRDCALTEEYAKAYKFGYELETILIGRKNNIEAEARNHRYRTLAEQMADGKYDAVFTAHHADDDVETMIMRLMSNRYPRLTQADGSFQRAVFGMRPISFVEGCRIMRPFLPFTKDNLQKISRIFSLPYNEDSTNRSVQFQRNKLRLQVMPLLKNLRG